MDWIKSPDRTELCLLGIITFFTIYTVAIYWYPILDSCILHGHNNSNKLVYFLPAHKKLSTIDPGVTPTQSC